MLDECFELYYRISRGNYNSSELRDLLLRAYSESPRYCMKTLLLIRGLKLVEDHRVIFMDLFKLIHPLYINEDEYWLGLIKYIPKVGRWDDLLYSWLYSDSFKFKSGVSKYLKNVYNIDLREVRRGRLPKSLLSKWMPSYTSGKSLKAQMSRSLTRALNIDKSTYIENLKLLKSRVDSVLDVYSNQVNIDDLLVISNSDELREVLDGYFKYEGDINESI